MCIRDSFTCRDEGRPYIGHVSATCFDNLGIPRSRNNSGSQNLPQERNRSGSGSRLQRRASTPGGYRGNDVYKVDDDYLSDNFDFSDGVFQIDEDFDAESSSTDEITYANTSMISTKTGEMAQLTVDKPTTDTCLLYTSPSPRDGLLSRMPSSA